MSLLEERAIPASPSLSIPPSPSSTTTSNTSISFTPNSSTATQRKTVRAKRSHVWRYFKSNNDNTSNTTCVLCSTVINRQSTSTSNLFHHLEQSHIHEYQCIMKIMKSSRSSSIPRLRLDSQRDEDLIRLAADLLIRDLLPLSIVESPQLQAIFHQAEPSFDLPK
ncbi:unnamed protein product [Didymodactylos carnosus]|uniref:BED-type domain-containing protein n=1 Tax=Didymodactylos carnosus TaxID=1234261 RepID=A0A814LV83_9BILA|nr:unnamed protein product [Didymodactylos carnosus]CAF1070606.1 unnamed protein product [Didymodactylos carnosus]CAF3581608.1 unnamed protein product [Didymodactylos carnosus]CAF3837769.1 unnamed protein product [Didymodactylos carnosus]